MAPKKNKKQAKKPKAPQAARKAQQPGPRLSRQPKAVFGRPGLVTAVCSQTDPFCSHARGAKLYDRSSTPSIGYQFQQLITMTTNASGLAVTEITAGGFNMGVRSAATFTGSAVATWGSYVVPTAASWLTSNAYSARVVSFGVRAFNIVSPMNASGLVTVATAASTQSAYDTSSPDYQELERYTLNAHESTWVGKPVVADFSNYTVVASVSTTVPTQWTRCYLTVEGGPASTAALSLEIVWNVEITLLQGTQVNLATPAAPHVSAIEDATAITQGSLRSSNPGPLATFAKTVERAAAGALKRAALDTVGSIPLIGGSLRAGAADAMATM